MSSSRSNIKNIFKFKCVIKLQLLHISACNSFMYSMAIC